MKKELNLVLLILCLFGIFFSSCEKEGWDSEQMSLPKIFKPIADPRASEGYGQALLEWELPDSVSTLSMLKVQWKNESGESGEQIYSKYKDSVWIKNLVEDNYTFSILSIGEKGEMDVKDNLDCFVYDWQKEPTEPVESFNQLLSENVAIISWKNPNHVTYKGVMIKMFTAIDSMQVEEMYVVKEEESKCEFQLAFDTEYICSYGSVNLVDSISEHSSFRFATSSKPPKVPTVELDSTSLKIRNPHNDGDTKLYKVYDFCHAAEVKWEPTVGMDTIMISYKDLDGEMRSSVFGGEKGFLTLLPGGEFDIEVRAKSAGGSWSLAKKQKLLTMYPEQTTTLLWESSGWKSIGAINTVGNLSQSIDRAVTGKGSGLKNQTYSFTTLTKIVNFQTYNRVFDLKELELCVNIEQITFNSSYAPDGKQITFDEYERLIQRLPKLKTLIINGWPWKKEVQAFVAEKYKHITVK